MCTLGALLDIQLDTLYVCTVKLHLEVLAFDNTFTYEFHI
jgi:hypothetical protein